jgi:hypothetical protein
VGWLPARPPLGRHNVAHLPAPEVNAAFVASMEAKRRMIGTAPSFAWMQQRSSSLRRPAYRSRPNQLLTQPVRGEGGADPAFRTLKFFRSITELHFSRWRLPPWSDRAGTSDLPCVNMYTLFEHCFCA